LLHNERDELRVEIGRMRAALEAVNNDYVLTGHLKQIVDEALHNQ
jgi:hypothetical protein